MSRRALALLAALAAACQPGGPGPGPGLGARIQPSVSEAQSPVLRVDLRLRRGERQVQFNGGYGSLQNDVARLVVGLYDNGSGVQALGYRFDGQATGSYSMSALTAANAPYIGLASEGVAAKLGTAGTGAASSGLGIVADKGNLRRYVAWDYGNGQSFVSELTQTRFDNFPTAAGDGKHSYLVFAAAWDAGDKNLGYTEAAVADSLTQGGNAAAVQLTLNLKQGVFTNNLSQVPILQPFIPDPAFSRQVSAVAGSTAGYTNANGAGAQFRIFQSVAVDSAGNLYVADSGNNVIRRITPNGLVETFAGDTTAASTDGTGSGASFFNPHGIVADAAGNLYVSDFDGNKIRKVTPGQVVTTFAGDGTAASTDGTGSGARFNGPDGLAIDSAGNLYVTEYTGNKIRKITPSRVVSTLAGSGAQSSNNGTGTAATFNQPHGIAVDGEGNVYVGEWSGNRVRKIAPDGVVTTLAGSGSPGLVNATGGAAAFRNPVGLAVDRAGNVFAADYANHVIRKITPAGEVSTFAGTGSPGATNTAALQASFDSPSGVTFGPDGTLYVADTGNFRIRKIK